MRAWRLARRQHHVVTHEQLVELGFTAEEIRHRVRTGRLHRIRRGVYAVGRPDLTRDGWLMAAVLSCGCDAALSHASAGEVWGLTRPRTGAVILSVPASVRRRGPDLFVHRRSVMPAVEQCRGVPATSPGWTLIDLAATLEREPLEAAINAADRLDLVDPERLRALAADVRGVPGARQLRRVLDRRTFVLTESALERLFLPIARRVGLPLPVTRTYESSFRVDFVWPELGLIVETDGLRYHRTPAQQTVDRLRDQTHAAAGRTPLRFTHEQIRYEPAHVERVLGAVAARLLAAQRSVT